MKTIKKHRKWGFEDDVEEVCGVFSLFLNACLYFLIFFKTLLYGNCMSFYRPFVRVDSYIVSRTVKKMGFFERIPPRQKSLTE